jgi:UDP-N-acetylglucosamine acyltransferase
VPQIHPTAIVEDGARLDAGVVVGAYAYIGGQVVMGPESVVGNHAMVQGRTTVGHNCHFHPGSMIGGIPQDLKYHGEPAELHIGDNNVFREHCTVHIGTEPGGMVTRIGSANLFMAGAHVAHDCIIGSGAIIANLGTLGGHVTVEDGVRIGGLAAVHQFVRIGRNAFVQGLAGVVQDIPPFMLASGVPARIRALNLEGLRRLDLGRDAITALKETFRLLYRSDLNRSQAIEEIQESARIPVVREVVNFLKRSKEGHLGRTGDTRPHDRRSSGHAQPPQPPPKQEEEKKDENDAESDKGEGGADKEARASD